MLSMHQLTTIFCEIDDFCNELDSQIKKAALPASPLCSNKRGPQCSMHDSELMMILIAFQMSGFRNFKHFYFFVQQAWGNYFPQLLSYQRVIELMKRVSFAMTIFAQIRQGKQRGIYYIDSTSLAVCNIKRSRSKVW